MQNKTWKVLAIIFFIILAVENLFFMWGYYLIVQDEKKTNECFYTLCEGHADALYEDDVCYCYDYSLLGELEISKTKYMK